MSDNLCFFSLLSTQKLTERRFHLRTILKDCRRCGFLLEFGCYRGADHYVTVSKTSFITSRRVFCILKAGAEVKAKRFFQRPGSIISCLQPGPEIPSEYRASSIGLACQLGHFAEGGHACL